LQNEKHLTVTSLITTHGRNYSMKLSSRVTRKKKTEEHEQSNATSTGKQNFGNLNKASAKQDLAIQTTHEQTPNLCNSKAKI